MRARRLRGDAGLLRQLARSERAAAHQRGEHVGARGIADERGDHGDIGTSFHSSMIAEALMSGKGVCLRDIEFRHCERSEAIHRSARTNLDCFVASLLAMT